MTRDVTYKLSPLVWVLAAFAISVGTPSALAGEAEDRAFKALGTRPWKEVFTDSCNGKWQDKWFLDGHAAKVFNDAEAMTIDKVAVCRFLHRIHQLPVGSCEVLVHLISLSKDRNRSG